MSGSGLGRWFARPQVRAGLRLTGLGLGALVVLRLALVERLPPGRCPEGLQLTGQRCCGAGQSWAEGACAGPASACSSTQLRSEQGQCVARTGSVSLAGGRLALGAADWEGASERERLPSALVAPFRLDVSEVTFARWASCVAQGACSARAGEPGLPVTEVSTHEAEGFCRQAKGRLPTAAEWVLAAAGTEARRFAWGPSGLVCRRAAFGLMHGPCGQAKGPELSGSRPDGASPDGILDLAGNVAEWTRELDGSYSARGGSFRSETAAELKSWSVAATQEKALHIGFRCAYPP